MIPLALCPVGTLPQSQAPSALGCPWALSPPGSRGAELSGRPELGGRRSGGGGRWGDPAGGEAPLSPSFLVPAAAAAAAQLGEEGAGDSETVTQRQSGRVGQGARVSMDPGVRGRTGISPEGFLPPEAAGSAPPEKGAGMEVETGHPPGSSRPHTL